MLKYYGHGANAPISPDLFTCLCPALLYQIDSRLCIEHFDKLLVEDINKDKSLVPEEKGNIGASGKKKIFSPKIAFILLSVLELRKLIWKKRVGGDEARGDGEVWPYLAMFMCCCSQLHSGE